jgi:acyl carrier protein
MQIENKIREFVLKNLYYSEDAPFGDEDSFLETGVIDSMGVMELVAFVQSEFAVAVGQEEIVVDNFDSIRKLADFVRTKLQRQAPRSSPDLLQEVSKTPSLAGR